METDAARQLPLAIIGAGPIGLSAAVHLADRGLDFVVLEKGSAVGSHVRQWGHVRMFSPWKYNLDRLAAERLRSQGWTEPDGESFPTGDELRERLLIPLAALPELKGRIRLGSEVLGVSRRGMDRLKARSRDSAPFQLRVRAPNGSEESLEARAVLDASGTWGNPKPLGANGLPAIGEAAAKGRIHYGMPDLSLDANRSRYAGKRIAIVGSGDSAFNTLIDFARFSGFDATLYWVLRGGLPSFGGGAADQLPQRAALAQAVRALVQRGALEVVSNFPISAIDGRDRWLTLISEGRQTIEVEEIICLTGFRPDLRMLGELRLDLDQATEAPSALGPLIDPNFHSCGTVPPHGYEELRQPESGFFLVGMKSYGRAPTFLLMTGYEQVRSVVAGLSGDLESARQVRLELPKTGVCSGGAQPRELQPASASSIAAVGPGDRIAEA